MKTIELSHSFTYRATDDHKKQLASAGSLKSLTKIIKKQSDSMNPDKYDPSKYCGDAFEWFAEFFFKYFDGDNLFLNVTEYSPTKATGDYGVDGVAKYTKNLIKTVCLQHKFKSNPSKILSANDDRLSNFGVNAVARYSCEMNSKYLIVFTNAAGVTRTTSEGIYDGNLTCINGEIISRYIDNNEAFWNCFLRTVS